MLKPWRNPFKKELLPAWALFVWQGSSLFGNANRIGHAMRWAWDAVTGTNSGHVVLVILSVVWIVTAMYWPSPKVWLFRAVNHTPQPQLPPMNDRIVNVEREVSGLNNQIQGMDNAVLSIGTLRERLDTTCQGTAIQRREINELLAFEKECYPQLENAKVLVLELRQQMESTARRLTEQRGWMSDIERSIRATHKDLGAFCQFEGDISILIAEAQSCIEQLEEIRAFYIDTEVGRTPFLKAWWRAENRGDTMAEPSEKQRTAPVRELGCCCCGNSTRGRQWWNRDTGYGICVDCIAYVRKHGESEAEIRDNYGLEGIHWGIPE